ncbi:hypothetical protein, partial [Streptomyces sp. NRRL WC-3742]|uniref:hypothetical protein n=1 Tax=Streptomyces sp. NRRL WC-3742 TaxID=1463934 RepID=UPI00055D461A
MHESAHPARHYHLVTPDGEVTSGVAPLREIRQRLEEGAGIGEAGFEHLSGAGHPIAVYYFVPYDQDTRRVNTTAGGMYWELTEPAGPQDATALDPDLRKIRLRGPVAFVARDTDTVGIDDQQRRLRLAHRQAVTRLRAKGWLPAPRPRAAQPAPPGPLYPIPADQSAFARLMGHGVWGCHPRRAEARREPPGAVRRRSRLGAGCALAVVLAGCCAVSGARTAACSSTSGCRGRVQVWRCHPCFVGGFMGGLGGGG